MTIKELRDATASLGFENELESDEGFFSAANRALYCANRIRPRTSELEVFIGDDELCAFDKQINGKCYKEFDMPALCPDFLCLAPSCVLYGAKPLKENEDFLLLNGRGVLLSPEKAGTYRIRYYKKLRRIVGDDEGMELELDEDICQILPLLVASYVWLEDEEEKAEKYKSLFYAEASMIEDFSKKSYASGYNVSEGWST